MRYISITFNHGNGPIPHTISQGFNGMLITFAKNYMDGGIGSGDVAGTYSIKD